MVLKRVMKRSFVLLITLSFLTLLMLYMINIVENKTILSNIIKLKYLDLQSKIYLKDIKEYIKSHNDDQIQAYNLNDSRFDLNIIKIDDNKTKYFIELKTKKYIIRRVELYKF